MSYEGRGSTGATGALAVWDGVKWVEQVVQNLGGGATGPTGPEGPQGPTGPAGSTGPQGSTGPAGADGVTGPQGPTGPAGPNGVTGPEGPTGPAGAVGATGVPGVTGATGPEGPALLAVIQRRVTPDANDLGVYTFDETSSTATAFANSGVYGSGSASGATFVASGAVRAGGPGILDKSILVGTGTTRAILRTPPGVIEPSTAISVSCWVYVRTYRPAGAAFGRILFKAAKAGASWASPFVALELGTFSTSTGGWFAGLRTANNGNVNISMSPNNGITLNNWHHIGVTYDGGTISAYLDGVLVGTASATGNIDYDLRGPWTLGGETQNSLEGSEFSIDDLRIADVARPASYFEEVYKAGIGYYDISQVTGPTGPVGPTGPTGPAGPAVTGAAGPQGDDGPTGPVGVYRLRAHDNTHSPVGLWQFDGNLLDSSGHGYHLSPATGTLESYSEVGPGLRGYTFDGLRPLVRTFAEDTLLAQGSGLSVMMLARVSSVPGIKVLVQYGGVGESVDTNFLYQILMQANQLPNFAYFAEYGAGANIENTATGLAVPLNEPFHLAFTRGTTGVKWFLDGRKYAEGPASGPQGGLGTGMLFIVGGGGTAASLLEAGTIISSLKVVPTTLSETDVYGEYNRTLGSEFVGVTGPVGPTGLQGSTGPVGPTGPIGSDGPVGAYKFRSHTLTYDPLALYTLDGTLEDATGNNPALTVFSGSADYAEVGPGLRGFSFDGTNYLRTNDYAPSLQATGPVTILAIAKLADSIPSAIYFINHAGPGEGQAENSLYWTEFTASRRNPLYIGEFNAGQNAQVFGGGAAPPLNEPFQFAMIRGLDYVSWMFNDKLYYSGAVATGVNGGQSGFLRIGNNHAELLPISRGTVISSVKIVPTSLSVEAVRSEYEYAVNQVFLGVTGPQGPVGPTGPQVRFSYPSAYPQVGSYMARPFERVAYVPSGSLFTVYAPTGPSAGDQFGVKNVSNSPTGIYLSGNGQGIEDPLIQYTAVATFMLYGNGIAVTWEYDGNRWNVI